MDKKLRITKLSQGIDLEVQLDKSREIGRKSLTNILNYLNFQDESVLVNFRHLKYDVIISIPAKPQPCLGHTLDCTWIEKDGLARKLVSSAFVHLLLADGQKLILVKPELIHISDEGVRFDLPDTCYELNSRRMRRYKSGGVDADIIQNGIFFRGVLRDFSTVSFCVELYPAASQSLQWINPEATVNCIFKKGDEVVYSGECRVCQKDGGGQGTFVLEPANDKVQRFKPKELRSQRQLLSPSPTIVFEHPLSGKVVSLDVLDISGSGFSVEESYETSVLLPGMIIPCLEIVLGLDCRIECKAQVVYARRCGEDGSFVKCGIAMLDMSLHDQSRLSALLHHASDARSFACSRVEPDEVWKFFFDSGFVYPEKYLLMHSQKQKFKDMYEKLYVRSPHISKHFIYRDDGAIKGHISMVRFYENTWLFQHHVAQATSRGAGGVVLEQIGRYVNDFYGFHSTRMHYVICYFRPEKRYPSRVFGGFSKQLNNHKGCSLDTFAYYYFDRTGKQRDLGNSWTLTVSVPEDLAELQFFYEHVAGGLLLKALDLTPEFCDCDEITREYHRIGLKRARYLFSLKENETLKAVLMVTVSDIGINLSNLTNCIHVLVLDTESLPGETLSMSLSFVSSYFDEDKIPVLIYPSSYPDFYSIPYEKKYSLWVISTQFTEHFRKYTASIYERFRHE